MAWFRIEEQGNAIGIYPTGMYRAASTFLRLFTGAIGGGAFAIVYYGIDYVGRAQAGVTPEDGFWMSVAILVGFFAVAYALIGALRFEYLVVDKSNVTMGKRWVFGPPTTTDIPAEDVSSITLSKNSTFVPATINLQIDDSHAAVFSSWLGATELEAYAEKARKVLEL